MAFTFDYYGLRYASPEAFDFFKVPATILLGTISSGRAQRGDTVYIELEDGTTYVSQVFQFYDDLYQCLGMPFYDYVDAERFTSSFAIVLNEQPERLNIKCPGKLVAFG